jgi:hypothetical protein
MIRLVGSSGEYVMIKTAIALALLTVASVATGVAASPSAAPADVHSYPTKLSINSAPYPFADGSVTAAVSVLPSAADPNIPGATGRLSPPLISLTSAWRKERIRKG